MIPMTKVATKSDRSKGWVKGRPLRFVRGHGGPISKTCRYRRVGIDGHYESAHAAVYRRLVSPVPEGRELHHLCEQPDCVRPDHLVALTHHDHLSLHKQKFSPDEIRAIRADQRPLREICESYEISYTYASSVRNGNARRDVT